MELETFVEEGTLVSPVALVFAGDRVFIADQPGIIWERHGKELEVFLDLRGMPDHFKDFGDFYDERGLLGLAFHPRFPETPLFYVFYSVTDTHAESKYANVLSEFDMNGGERRLLRIATPQANHSGGHLLFGPDNYLYIGVGDGGGK